MKKFKIVGLTFAAVCALSAFVASSAFAAAEWLVEKAAIKAGENVTVNQTTEAGNLLLLEDMSEGVDVLCAGTGTGTITSGGGDSQTAASCPAPVVDAGTCGSPIVTAVHLPWTTELLEPTAGTFVDDIKMGTGGNPGWLVECTVGIIKVNDECTTAGGSTLLKNEANGTVDATFEPLPEALCTIPDTEKGLVEGLVLLEALKNGAKVNLEVS
jgi:hypothetical protein